MSQTAPNDDEPAVDVTIRPRLGLTHMQKQKKLLYSILGDTKYRDQHDAAEGLLGLLDFLQDAIVDQGLATEQDVFGRDYGKDTTDDEDRHEC